MYGHFLPSVNSRSVFLYCRESNLAISSYPVTNNNLQFIVGVLLPCENKKIFSSAPGLSVMTHPECRVDRPFPVT
jgi:hypothetical protein